MPAKLGLVNEGLKDTCTAVGHDDTKALRPESDDVHLNFPPSKLNKTTSVSIGTQTSIMINFDEVITDKIDQNETMSRNDTTNFDLLFQKK